MKRKNSKNSVFVKELSNNFRTKAEKTIAGLKNAPDTKFVMNIEPVDVFDDVSTFL